ncbi:sensor domain-containing diguanylate cyclase [Alkalibacter rhizosphaerae]|uniref:Sensor domain-containing diguanylate cyclase n=1 Tax=Alkalibacter rhizosphaerae TaxID=2815577 RepID=A0A974XEG7_9FIRM|nr:diguanylate cyclase [Alkalibacter rhizosphaerae]QSX08261.1 sensor domain-containing diguanylate cyclase [Alkalibacter rhizosphaerae]
MRKKSFYKIRDVDPVRKKYLAIAIAIFLCFALILTLVLINQLDRIDQIHATSTRDQIVSIKREFLQDSVNNTIDFIEESKLIHESRLEERIHQLKVYVQTHQRDYSIDDIREYFEGKTVGENLVIWIVDVKKKINYVNDDASEMHALEKIIDFNDQHLFFRLEVIPFNNYTIYLGALNQEVKNAVEESLRRRIYGDIYFQDSYMWVNEVIDFDGGKDYAVRLIHPNLKETEGTLLSTDMEDIAGGKPYLEELEGIKRDGELFFNYFFKKLGTEELAEKMTYAKLYDEYNWVVAMGVYYDNLQDYINDASENSRTERNRGLLTVALSALLLLLVGILVFLWSEKRYYSKSTQKLKDEIDMDLLTGAGSRKAGLVKLQESFRKFKEQQEMYSLLMLDLDDFKHINDTYGHDTGDRVLVEIVKRIKEVIREEDGLYRWGGEEFVILAKGITPENLDILIDKVLKAVEGSKCIQEGANVPTTVSIGATNYLENDETYESALIRADQALYESKKSGKNKGTKFF